jgi:hypothetical protein
MQARCLHYEFYSLERNLVLPLFSVPTDGLLSDVLHIAITTDLPCSALIGKEF